MFNDFCKQFKFEGLGSVAYTEPPGPGAAAVAPTVTGADSGTSLVGTKVVLGNQTGSTTSAALLSNAAIPLNGFALSLTGIGGVAVSTPASNLLLQQGASIIPSSPEITFSNSASAEIGRINFTNEPGVNSIFIGLGSGAAYTGGGVNTALGTSALASITSGSRNTAIGAFSLNALTTASFNTAVGEDALDALTTGSENTAIGRNAGLNITTGSLNVMIGGEINTPGGASSNNVMVGTGAGGGTGPQVNVTGNTLVGHEILFAAPTYGNNNTIVGFENFTASNVIGSTNIVVGASNASAAGSLVSNNIIIGNSVTFQTTSISNSIVINDGTTAFALAISNVIIIGDSSQHTILGASTLPTDNGNTLQVIGNATLFHLIGETAKPTIVAAAGVTSAVITAGTDLAGQVTITNGATPISNALVATVTFAVPYAIAPYVFFSRASNTTTNTLIFFVQNTTVNGFQIFVGGASLTAALAETFNYAVFS